jgi:hypothetical protein
LSLELTPRISPLSCSTQRTQQRQERSGHCALCRVCRKKSATGLSTPMWQSTGDCDYSCLAEGFNGMLLHGVCCDTLMKYSRSSSTEFLHLLVRCASRT